MSEVRVIDELNTSADSLWAIAGNFGDMSWSSAIESCSVEGEGVGAVRTFTPKGAPEPMQERLEAFDAAARSFSYAIIGKNPLPCDDYLAHVKISELGADRCRIEWTGSFEPRGVPEDKVKPIVEGIYRGAIAAYKKLLEK